MTTHQTHKPWKTWTCIPKLCTSLECKKNRVENQAHGVIISPDLCAHPDGPQESIAEQRRQDV